MKVPKLIVEDEQELDEEFEDSSEESEYLDQIFAELDLELPPDLEGEKEETVLDDEETIDVDEESEPAEEFEYADEKAPESVIKAPQRAPEDPDIIKPISADVRGIIANPTPAQIERVKRLVSLLKSHDVEPGADPREIDWKSWSQDDIREYNTLVKYLKSDNYDWAKVEPRYKIDPYAMAQISPDLWPDVAVGDKTVRREIKEILHDGNPNAWAQITSDQHARLERLFAYTMAYYKNKDNLDKTTQIDRMKFLNEYSEYNSITPGFIGMTIGLWKVKDDPQNRYVVATYDEYLKAQKLAKQEGRDEVTIYRGKEIPIEPVLVDPKEIKDRLSFAPRAGRRVIDNNGWSLRQKVGGLNNAIVNLFSSKEFDPYYARKNPGNIDWPAVARLAVPLKFYKQLSRGVRGDYLAGFTDDQLLKLYRMFLSALPSSSRYDDKLRAVQDQLRQKGHSPEHYLKLKQEAEKLQDLIDDPKVPNREDFYRNYINGKEYPARVASPADDVEGAIKGLGDLYLYRMKNPPANVDPLVVSPRKYGEDELPNYEYIGPFRDKIDLGVVGELRNIEKIIDKARDQLKQGEKDIKAPAPEPKKSVEELWAEEDDEFDEEFEIEEGIVTTPVTIMVNGNPFKLHFGDRLIIDNVKSVNSQQK